MHTIELTDDELELLRLAVRMMRNDFAFGRDEAETLARLQALIAKLEQA